MSDAEPFTCTKEHPWNDSMTGEVRHPDAKKTSTGHSFMEGFYDVYDCPHCGGIITVHAHHSTTKAPVS